VLLLGSLLAHGATACSCDKAPTTKEEYTKSDLVIEGKVISFDTIKTATEILLRYKVLIIQDFKTTYTASDTIYVLTSQSISGCRYPFIPTQDYLVYASKVDLNVKSKSDKGIDHLDRTFVTSCCRLTQMSNEQEKARLKGLKR
jgi:hypothetical protein